MGEAPNVPKHLQRKLEHAYDHLLKSDSILEFALDYPDAGLVAGMMNNRLDKKEGHTLLLQHEQRRTVEVLKADAEAQYSLVFDEASLPLDSTVLVVSSGNAANLKALQAYVVRRASETPPRAIIWECPYSDQNAAEHAFLHQAASLWNLKPHITGYENVYIEGDAPSRILHIPTLRMPRAPHYIIAGIVLVVVLYIVYSISNWLLLHFLSTTAPSTKSLPKSPT